MNAGEYHPRIGRPQKTSWEGGATPTGPFFVEPESSHLPVPYDAHALGRSLNQLSALTKRMEATFDVVDADQRNISVFGHEFRNITILACTLFESECRAVLRENTYPMSTRLSMVDYFKLYSPLKLNEYEISFTNYPALDPVQPFRGWSASAPTQSFSWYHDYNAIKHDSETEFFKSTLANALNSVCACTIIIAAQYRIIYSWENRTNGFYLFDRLPIWSDGEKYIPQPEDCPVWRPLSYIF